MVASPNNTFVTGEGASITDASGNIWTIDADRQITVNGAVDPTTANVDELAFSNGLVWQKNADNNWYSKSSPSDTWAYSPTSGPAGLIPDVSANDAKIAPGNGASLVDANGNVWSLTTAVSEPGYQVWVDGAVDPTTANVVQMAYVDGTIWQENTSALWYSKTTPASAWSAATAADPLTGVPEPVSAIWVGGGDNLASDPVDWSTGLAPADGVQLFMGSGTMNLAGDALADNTLNIMPGSTVNFDVTSTALLDLSATRPSSAINLDLAPDSTLTLNAQIVSGTLNASGGTIAFIGSNTFDAFKTTLADNLTGTASLNLLGGNATGEYMEVNGSVGSGLSFNISAPGPDDAGLQIDQPSAFQGAVTLYSGFVAFMGVQATSAELLNGVLTMFNGSTVVDATRFTSSPNDPGATLQLQQNSDGVMASVGIASHYQPGGVGTVLPLTT